MTTAQVTMETSLSLKHRNVAGIVFQPLATTDFKSIVTDTEELLRGSAQDTGTTVDTADDEFGYLVVSVNVVSGQLEGGGYGDRLLAAVFAFEEEGRPIFFIYNFKRGAYYPFVPGPGERQRNNERELQLKAALETELPMEQELERWYPLWEIP